MTFAAPLWLAGLLPWAALTIYLLWGRRKRVGVPFLALWLGPVEGPRAKRKLAVPPAALVLALLALLLAVLTAAGPAVRGAGAGERLTVILDRGAGMSAWSGAAGGPTRLQAAAADLDAELRTFADPSTVVDLLPVPGADVRRTTVGDWLGDGAAFHRTELDTAEALQASVSRRLAEAAGPVIVVTDRPLATPAEDGRVIRVPPAGVRRNVAIVAVAARESPRPQLMLRLQNDGVPGRVARVLIETGGVRREHPAELPPSGASADLFFDLPSPGDTIRAEVRAEEGDDFGGDDVAWLVREGSWPKIEPATAISPALARMVRTYADSRPPTQDSPRVPIVGAVDAAAGGEPAVVVERDLGATGQKVSSAAGSSGIRSASHPITQDVDWEALGPIRASGNPPNPSQGWRPLAWLDDQTVVAAARERPARQVWVGFDAPQWPRRPGYVVFWANVFDWIAAGSGAGPRYSAHNLARLGPEWSLVDRPESRGDRAAPTARQGEWPGLYRRSDGRLRAVNPAPAPSRVLNDRGASEDWRLRLRATWREDARRVDLGPYGAVAAVACVVLSVARWRRRHSLTEIPVEFTVAGSAGSAAPGRRLGPAARAVDSTDGRGSEAGASDPRPAVRG